ncbi:acyl-CoA dehydrogenase family protein [Candidatus Mycobacterium wuenschmannii]|uniref:Acyl-CoA dehydrogenase family protein n=1 Tax=Candidatus Mycobacterium wuenschmannii TaxID=3027808 RepID=A0ABY8W1Z6_9MYCO|nr:acyl-CoA dehydrogenase family protein [Candidatus Mycobacterium wuenschmannii]WIM89039.1 acyl-CoA dehydrogenase family protein [Candidatus Mycobacterium wuenschmannii]
MKLLPSSDERDLASMLSKLFDAECPVSLVREMHDGRTKPDRLWKALADAGVFGLLVPPEHDGAGGALTDLGVFYVEAGRALCPTIVHGTLHAAFAIQVLGGPDQQAAWLPSLADGKLSATTCLSSVRNAADVTPTLRARSDGEVWRLDGAVDFVSDADLADYVVVTASAPDLTLGFVVPLEAVGLKPQPLMGGHRAFRLVFQDVEIADRTAVLGESGLAVEDLRRVANAAVALQSLDLVGVGEAALQRTVEYTKARKQFGRPIASFQAAQHLVANMHIALAAARLAAHSAVFSIGQGHTANRQTAIARMHAGAAAKLITLDAHQLHGGMGYVVDTDLHLFSERARVLSTLGGGADIAATWMEES